MECVVCSEAFDESSRKPLGLPCGHTFCRTCIDGISTRQGGPEGFPCPDCRTLCTLASARPNFGLLSVIQSMQHPPAPPPLPAQPSHAISQAVEKSPVLVCTKPESGIAIYAHRGDADFGAMGVLWDPHKQCLWVPSGTDRSALREWLPRQPGTSTG
jgi:hypothetical protein